MKQIFTLLLLSISMYSNATSFDNLWFLTSQKTISIPGERKIIPLQYQLAKLKVNEFQFTQAFIPNEESGAMASIFLPTPDGSSMEFNIFEKSMMEKKLAEKYAQIKTYTAICKKDTRITAKIDFTLFGFHAVVFNGNNTFYIDPYSNQNNEWYVVYYKKDFVKKMNERMHCEVDETNEDLIAIDPIQINQTLPTLSSYKTNGDTNRIYRLALSCTEEYAAAVGGATPTIASVLSAMVTSINRVNGVFEREFSMHANLVALNDTLIFLPGSGDPFTNGSGATMLGQNKTLINARIGTANYDYGHVFSTGGGGIATLTSICGNNKAQGVTGSSNPVGDPFDIDYVAHEMGHQFGGSHTFNSITGSCSGNRSTSSAYEIGSATTIQGYAGICGTDDIQPHSDDYYHVRSLESMTSSAIKACAAKTVSGNTPPVLTSIAKSYIIPYKTPFELTAIATDANNDPLTYCWEEYDRGGSGNAWDDPTTVAPILRSFNPDASSTRVFPQYKELIKNTESYLGERLPDTTRIVKFRCTVRDMHLGNGSFYTSVDTTKLDVKATSGLFRVTSQNTTGISWNGFSTQTITWNVAGTNASPFTSTNVDIYVSVDSGKTWPHIVASATANDGSENIVVPNVDAKWARVKVKGNGNVFFDLNDEWLEIKKVTWPTGLSETSGGEIFIYPNPTIGILNVELSNVNGAIQSIEILNTIGQVVYYSTFNTSSLKSRIDISNFTSGVYYVKVKTQQGNIILKKLIVAKEQ